MKITCPKCNAEYDLDTSYSGEKVECACGEKYYLPVFLKKNSELKEKFQKRKIQCPACKKEHVFLISGSNNEIRCPECQHVFDYLSPKAILGSCLFLVILLGLIVWWLASCISACGSDHDVTPSSNISLDYESAKEAHRNAWNGSNRILVEKIKDLMNDPSSFEHVGTYWVPSESGEKYYGVRMKYRGKNSFGAIMTEEVTAVIDFNGNILRMEKLQ